MNMDSLEPTLRQTASTNTTSLILPLGELSEHIQKHNGTPGKEAAASLCFLSYKISIYIHTYIYIWIYIYIKIYKYYFKVSD